jgi:hypothetical protein
VFASEHTEQQLITKPEFDITTIVMVVSTLSDVRGLYIALFRFRNSVAVSFLGNEEGATDMVASFFNPTKDGKAMKGYKLFSS